MSDFSDYDSSDDERRQPAQARRQSTSQGGKRNEVSYRAVEEESGHGRKGLLDPNDPFGDPFADGLETPMQERPRMQCAYTMRDFRTLY